MTPDPDLSSVFGASAAAQRREQLGGLLPRRSAASPQVSDPEESAAEPTPPVAPENLPGDSRPVPPPPLSAPAPGPAELETQTRPVTVYVRAEVVETAQRRRRQHPGTSYADIALEAIEVRRGELTALVSQRHSGTVRPASGLFPARGSRRPRREGTPRVPWTIFLTEGEIQVIDKLGVEAAAASRSELISVAVEAQLGN